MQMSLQMTLSTGEPVTLRGDALGVEVIFEIPEADGHLVLTVQDAETLAALLYQAARQSRQSAGPRRANVLWLSTSSPNPP